MNTEKRKIFIVDNHPLLIDGLRSLIERQEDLSLCGYTTTAAGALARISEARPELVVIKEENGFPTIRALHQQFPELFILCLSNQEEIFYAPRALRAGAHGFIMKTESVEKIMDAIRKVLDGQVYVSERVRMRMLLQSQKRGAVRTLAPMSLLSKREQEVIRHIGEARDNQDIGKQMHLSVKTVIAHQSRIKKKLRLTSTFELVRFALHWVKQRQEEEENEQQQNAAFNSADPLGTGSAAAAPA